MTLQRTLSELLSTARMATVHVDEQVAFDGQHRSAFETDGDKIGFAEGFRALADKTQVHDRVERNGNHRNRLTHSIEVSRVGRSLGVAVGARMISFYGLNAAPTGEAFWRVDPSDIGHVVAAACMAHDIGNPPFGHDGEEAISAFFAHTETGQRAVRAAGPEVGAEICHHEGNAQGFRMITRSQGWRAEGGLNLTAATLGAFGKYPFPLLEGARKYGVHKADLETLRFVADATGMRRDGQGWIRHPLAWLMEAADDICYLTVDLEDAAALGIVSSEDMCALYEPVIGSSEIRKGRRMGDPGRMVQYLRSRVIKALINGCVEAYPEIAQALEDGGLGDTPHGKGLIAHTRHAGAMQAIRSFSRESIYQSETTQTARAIFRNAMHDALDLLVSDLLECLRTGESRPHARPGLARLPHARSAVIPDTAEAALPWLLDEITLMSDSQILGLSETAHRELAAPVPAA